LRAHVQNTAMSPYQTLGGSQARQSRTSGDLTPPCPCVERFGKTMECLFDMLSYYGKWFCPRSDWLEVYLKRSWSDSRILLYHY